MEKDENPQKPINKVIDQLVLKYGGKNTVIARKLSDHSEKPVSQQRIGQYRKGPKQPGPDFLLLWREVYGDDILELTKQDETKVSRGIKNELKHTQDREAAVKEKPLSWDEERGILIESLKQFGETNAYLLKRIKELGG